MEDVKMMSFKKNRKENRWILISLPLRGTSSSKPNQKTFEDISKTIFTQLFDVLDYVRTSKSLGVMNEKRVWQILRLIVMHWRWWKCNTSKPAANKVFHSIKKQQKSQDSHYPTLDIFWCSIVERGEKILWIKVNWDEREEIYFCLPQAASLIKSCA